MVGTLLGRIFEAYQDPQSSARRLLAARPTRRDGFLMVLAGTLLGLCALLGAQVLTGRTREGVMFEAARNLAENPQDLIFTPTPMAQMILEVGVQSFGFYLVAAMGAHLIGRWASGKGDFDDLIAVTGWWSIVWAPAQFISMLAFLGPGSGALQIGLGVGFGVELILLYIYAGFVAAAHGFQSALRVFFTSLGVVFGLALVVGMFFIGAAAAQ